MDPNFDQGGSHTSLANQAAWRAPTAPQRRNSACRITFSFIIVPPLLVFVAAGSWLIWTLADDALGSRGASLTVFALLAGTFAVSRRIGGDFASALMLIALGGLAAPIWAMFGLVGYALLVGG